MSRASFLRTFGTLALVWGLGGALGAQTIVQTSLGAVRRVRADGIDVFRGLPFAQPPVGDLRWRPPQPVRPWSGVRDAAKFGPSSPQTGWGPGASGPVAGSSEDCLYLNVWTPGTKGPLRPVMVWIHGGGFTGGSGASPESEGTHFAQDGVVLVTINYRLGRFGFFAFPALDAEDPGAPKGNFGYMDQIAALKWVQDHIADFGGDPRQVTIFGESAGGVSVHTLLTIPQARGLFARAIVESGGGREGILTGRPLREDGQSPFYPVSAETAGVNFARSRGIQGTDQAALQKLRALGTAEILDGGRATDAEGRLTLSGPILDGRLVVENFPAAYQGGRQADVALMIGSNSAEVPSGFINAASKAELWALFGPLAAEAARAYDPAGTKDFAEVLTRVTSDTVWAEPARFTARAFAQKGSAAYVYLFSYVPASMQAMMPFGAMHTAEIGYAFGNLSFWNGAAVAPRDLEVARQVHGYWVNFAKTGNPNGPGLAPWSPFTLAGDQILEVRADGTSQSSPDFRRARLDVVQKVAEGTNRGFFVVH